MGLKNFLNKCGARLQKPGAQRKRGDVKHILEAMSCANGKNKIKKSITAPQGASPQEMNRVKQSIATGQTGLHECCPTGLAAHTKVVLFYDLTSMGATELGDAFISANKFFNEVKASHGFFGDVYHVGALGERWVSWPAWVLNRNVHTRGIDEHVNAPGNTGSLLDALSQLGPWKTAHANGTITGTVNGAVTFLNDDTATDTTVYYGANQTSPSMPPVFSNTEELLVIGFEDEVLCTPNMWAKITNYTAAEDGPAGTWNLGGYYDQDTNLSSVATDGSYVTTWENVAASHTCQVGTLTQLGGTFALLPNPQNTTLHTDHSGDTANWAYDATFWTSLGLSGSLVTTNSCDGLTASGNNYDWISHWDWMSANHHSTDCRTITYEMSDIGYAAPPATCPPGPNGDIMGWLAYYTCQDITGATVNTSYTLDDLIIYINSVGCSAATNAMTFLQLRAVWKAHLGGAASNNGAAYLNSGVNYCACTSAQGGKDGCIINPPLASSELNYTFNHPSSIASVTGTMVKYRQTENGGHGGEDPNMGTPTVEFQNDYCIAKKVINAHMGNIRYFLYSVPPVAASRNYAQVMFPLQVLGAMENGPLAVAPTGSYCDLTNITVSGPYNITGFNNMKAWGAGFGYNVMDLPCSSAQFSTDIQAYLNL